MWVEKYRPRSLETMIGNEEARLALLDWLSRWKPGGRAALLMGPPGTGKTTAVTLIAKERGMNLIELNASDVRTKEKLRAKMGEAMITVSLFGERSLIFLDEVDGLAGRADYGAIDFIKDSVKVSKNPIVMAANDPDADEIKKLASSCVALRFRPPPPREVEMYLREIASKERVTIGDEELRSYVVDSGGDVRQAVSLLQSRPMLAGGAGGLHFKDRDLTVTEAFDRFFEAEDKVEASAAMRGLFMSPFEKVREVHRAVMRSGLAPKELARALEVVSRGDMLIGEMMKAGDWRLLRYLDRLFVEELYPIVRSAGARYSAQEDIPFPLMVRVWNDSRKTTELSARYASRARTSGRSARTQDLPYVFSMCSGKKFREEMEHALGLDADKDLLESYDKFLRKEAAR